VSSSVFTFTIIVTIIISVFVPGRSRVVQKLKKCVCTTRVVRNIFEEEMKNQSPFSTID
jgi:hypothetical protein